MAVNYNSGFVRFNSYKMFLSNHVIDNNIKIPKLWKLRNSYKFTFMSLRTYVLDVIIERDKLKK